jgi:hypothetical protein
MHRKTLGLLRGRRRESWPIRAALAAGQNIANFSDIEYD